MKHTVVVGGGREDGKIFKLRFMERKKLHKNELKGLKIASL